MEDIVPQLLNQAVKFHQIGKLDKAYLLYLEVLKYHPNHPDALNLMGVMAGQVDKPQEAINLITHAIEINPNETNYYLNLARAYEGNQEVASACDIYQQALKTNPSKAVKFQILSALGHLYQQLKQGEKALNAYKKALKIKPESDLILNNLALAYQMIGNFGLARRHMLKAIEQRPDKIDYLINLGNIYRLINDFDQARDTYQQVLNQYPNSYQALNNLGSLLIISNQAEEALPFLKKALELSPQNPSVFENLAQAYRQIGMVEKAHSNYERQYEILALEGIKLKQALLLPPIYQSEQHIDECRQNLLSQLHQLNTLQLSLKELPQMLDQLPFYLAYHGKNDLEINSSFTRLILKACPNLSFKAKHCSRKKRGKKIKIGFVSRYFYNHTVGRFIKGTIRFLNRESFKVYTFSFSQIKDDVSNEIRSHSDQFLELPQDLEAAREMIADQQLDIILYPELGVDTLTYLLAFSRLAPLQCTTYGHGTSLGLPEIDIFFSNQELEEASNQEYYSEKLILMEHLFPYFDYPPKAREKTLIEMGLPRGNIYLCPQSLFKIHPQFDPYIQAILEKDPEGHLILISGQFQYWNDQLLERFKTTLPDQLSQIHFIERLNPEDFLSLCLIADVILDPILMSGGISSLEALSTGTPIITHPGHYIHSRSTYAYFKKLNALDTVVHSLEEYSTLAVKIANSSTLSQTISFRILENLHVLYESTNGVRELESLLFYHIDKKLS